MSLVCLSARAEQLPVSVRGSWRIARILPTTNTGCWTHDQAQTLVGTTLTYSQFQMRWRGGVVQLQDIDTRRMSADQFRKENSGPEQPASFAQIGVRVPVLIEVDMQHEDADVLPASTDVPGDSVLMVAPDRIVVNACGVYYEATRSGSRSGTRVQAVSGKRTQSNSPRATGR